MTHSDRAFAMGKGLDAAASLASAQLRRESVRIRVAVVVLAALGVGTLVFMVPAFGIGMQAGDYNVRVVAALVLLAALGASATAAAVRWAPTFHQEPLSEFLSVVMGQSMVVRGPARFLRRLESQCERARSERGAGFSLLVLDLPDIDRGSPEGEALHAAWLAVARASVRAQDVVGDSGEGEIWLLLESSGPEGCLGVAERIRDYPASEPAGTARPGGGRLGIGFSTFAADGRDPEALFRVARIAARVPAQVRPAA